MALPAQALSIGMGDPEGDIRNRVELIDLLHFAAGAIQYLSHR